MRAIRVWIGLHATLPRSFESPASRKLSARRPASGVCLCVCGSSSTHTGFALIRKGHQTPPNKSPPKESQFLTWALRLRAVFSRGLEIHDAAKPNKASSLRSRKNRARKNGKRAGRRRETTGTTLDWPSRHSPRTPRVWSVVGSFWAGGKRGGRASRARS